jgi:hypothetical protein
MGKKQEAIKQISGEEEVLVVGWGGSREGGCFNRHEE